ncbi:MAG: MlaD family protein [Candidatus Thiocaldithrix dubininis]|jgi:paraquat-inducible protein B|uniref:MlaD family protein n=1 Tax=Candidatus Thiocaldithrix dubininis TaxID=3080823 RepID=A0AA95HAJ3_9GAMM|nr:MAG: MlaD family protein [Candidatus Thiocaldithrix dubininis]
MVDDTFASLPSVAVRKRRWPSPIWLLPLIALLIGLWLLYQNWYKTGPTIVVQFTNAEGIEPGKTEVRYKAVAVGKLKSLRVSDDLKYVDAEIILSRDMGKHLGSDARFWIVSPRITRSGISGLSTFFSGTYIGMSPGTNSDDQTYYMGEDRPPVIAPTEAGRRFYLLADSLGSIDIGAPIFYKQLQVGEVIDFKLLDKNAGVQLEVFIRDPYYELVRNNSRFWNASGAEFKFGANGATFRMESLTSLISGGIAFETPKAFDESPASPAQQTFVLYKNYDNTQEKQYAQRLYYVMHFQGNVRGLAVGNPVEFQGVPVGQVENIDIRLDKTSQQLKVPVLVSIQPQQFDESLTPNTADMAMRQLVDRGLRAKLDTSSLLTGQKVITLTMEKSPKSADIVKIGGYSEFPTISAALDDLPAMAADVMSSLQETLDGVKRIVNSGKLDKTIDSANSMLKEVEKAVKEAQKVIKQVDQQTLPGVTKNLERVTGNVDQVSQEFNRSLQQLQGSLEQIDRLTARNSPTQYQLDEMMEEVTNAARSVRTLSETLERKPNSLLRGKPNEALE